MLKFVCTLLVSTTLLAQNLLKPTWKFKTGDDASYAEATYKDNQWATITAGLAWEKQGYDAYDGIAWYRTTVVIPSSMKAEAVKNGGVLLTLGAIDDCDETYFNGTKIGATGTFPPNFVTAYADVRAYTIPVKQVRWDQANTLAIRVFDGGGGGGLNTQAPELKIKGATDNIAILPKIKQTDRVFVGITNIMIPMVLSYSGNYALEGSLKIQVRSDFGVSILDKTYPVFLGKKSNTTIPVSLGSLAPGFYNMLITLESSTSNKVLTMAFAVDPEKVVSAPDPKPDFEAYWKRAKRELAAVEPQYTLIKQDSLCTETRDVYIVAMRSLGNVLVRGWYAVPKKPGKYPAILHVQGYSSFLKLDWAYKGDDFAVFALNIRGHGFSKDNINPGFPGYLQHFVTDKEMYIYRGAYMDTRRALEFLYSRPEVDTSWVVVEGGSQGGALSVATAALNPGKVKLCIPAVPFLSDFQDYFKVGNWPANEFKAYVAANPQINWATIYETLSYIDIKNLAPYVTCPVLMGVGLLDDICPPHINFAMYNNLKVPKEYVVYPTAGHGLPNAYNTYKFEWTKRKLAELGYKK